MGIQPSNKPTCSRWQSTAVRQRTDVSDKYMDIREVKEQDAGGYYIMRSFIMKNAILWDVTSCVSCQNRRAGGTYRLNHRGEKFSDLGTTLAGTTSNSTTTTTTTTK
jgi:hypothetical protein